ncbi:major facilitator superfamily domain-containing protein [Xylariales sp. PMI_506]|nr:major facilitator superfamily domain-containing protein [Xylariales sp. PMI_506]
MSEKNEATEIGVLHQENQTSPHIQVEEEPSSVYDVGWKTIMAIVALSMANTCAAISNTSNTIIRTVVADLGDAALASWIANANLLVSLAFAPVLGSLSDRFGKKWFIVIASVIGVVGSVISGSAKHTTTIIAGNVLTGLANAGCIMGVPAAQEVTPNRYRPWTMGFSQALASCAVIAGTLGAGAFVKFETWRWSFYLNAFVYGTSAVLVGLFYYPPPPTLRRQEGRVKALLARIDYVGILLLTGSLASLVLALTWGGSAYAWNSSHVLAPLIMGCIGLLGFGIYEWLVVSEGIFDHRMFQSRNFPILLFACVVDGMLLLGVNVLFAQEIAILFTTDSVKIASILTPFLATSAFGCFPAGFIMAHTKSYRTLLVGCLLWCSLFTGLMALVNPNRLTWAYALSAMFGIGTAVTTVIPIVALGLSVPSFLLGTAGTISVSMRALGGIIGITIFTTVYDNKIGAALPADVSAVLVGAGLPNLIPDVLTALGTEDPTALGRVSGLPASLIPQIVDAVYAANTYSWQFVWIAISVVVLVGAIASCFLEPVAAKMNNHIESALEESEVRQEQMGAHIESRSN